MVNLVNNSTYSEVRIKEAREKNEAMKLLHELQKIFFFKGTRTSSVMQLTN